MPATPSPVRRRTPLPVVAGALLLACLTVAWSTGVLVREPVGVTQLAIARDVPLVEPGEPVGAADAEGLHLYLVPHPDDELSGWASLVEADDLYPVVVVLSQGEATARCTPETYAAHLESDLGEIVPQPDPTAGRGTQVCRDARLGSLKGALDEAAGHSSVVEGLATAPATAVELPSGPATVQVGPHAAMVVLDLGDSELAGPRVLEASEDVLGRAGAELPDLPLARVTASAYLARDGVDDPGCEPSVLCPADDGPYVYDRTDHAAAHEAARALAGRTTEGAWLVTHPYDPAAEEFRALPQEVYDAFLGLGGGPVEDAERLGSYQRWYGWLAFPDVWRAGDLPLASSEVLFPRVQSFEVVAP